MACTKSLFYRLLGSPASPASISASSHSSSIALTKLWGLFIRFQAVTCSDRLFLLKCTVATGFTNLTSVVIMFTLLCPPICISPNISKYLFLFISKVFLCYCSVISTIYNRTFATNITTQWMIFYCVVSLRRFLFSFAASWFPPHQAGAAAGLSDTIPSALAELTQRQ